MADDLIRRSDAVRVVRDSIDYGMTVVIDSLNALPAATPEPPADTVPPTRVRCWRFGDYEAFYAMKAERDGIYAGWRYGDTVYEPSQHSIGSLSIANAGYEEIAPDAALALLRDWPEGREKFLQYCRENPPLPTPEPPPAESAADAGVTVTRELAGKIERLSKALIDMNITLCKYVADDDNLTPLQCEALRAAYIAEQDNASMVFHDLAAAGMVGDK